MSQTHRETMDWETIFESCGAILNGHFLLSSGRHSDRYVQCAKVLEAPQRAEALGRVLVEKVAEPFDTVIAAPLGGLLIGHEVARAAGRRFLFAERAKDGAMTLRRGFTVNPGEKILVVEDVITTGRTTRELLALIDDSGAKTVGLVTIVDRSETNRVDEHEILSALRLPIQTFEPEECPLCKDGIPVVKPGSRAQQQVKGTE